MQVEQLFQQHGQMVYRVCIRYVEDKQQAEDLMQDVFVKVYENQAGYRGNSSSLTWIYRIAVNHCLDHIRSRKSELERCLKYMDESVRRNLGDESAPTLARLTLEKILEDQDPVNRQILFLYHAEGLSQDEIAGVLGMSRAAISKRLNRSMDELRKLNRRMAEKGISSPLVFKPVSKIIGDSV